ncbi:MAG: 50S ribosomal protein L39e [Candidatus Bathyarchaeia archaeon]
MARFKTPYRKIKLARAQRRSRSVPSWIIAKTRGGMRRTPTRRHWRRTKIKP